ncbi:unnamed protein product [Microthlaspi erraticum]|uniref:HMA domain-containing protein n=1 Tax=Microthlaspi erraticum TaxID=1685480 RepID=A0A6D2JQY2_9BRAS|nr:unnamed protein product [Microthlaspi erraticum]
MKGRMFCASQASTAICSSMDHIDKPTTVDNDERNNGRAIDRHNPIIKDGRRSSVDDYIRIPADGEISNKTLEIYKGRRSITARKSTGGGGGGGAAALLKLITSDISLARKSFSCVARPACDFIKTPPGSTRYLLGSDPDSVSGSAGQDSVKTKAAQSPSGEEIKPTSFLAEKKSTSGCGSNQVVVLKVSLHCRGCEGKVRKHLARMQGVTSFNIDFAAKKVTVTGDLTPLEILDSISKADFRASGSHAPRKFLPKTSPSFSSLLSDLRSSPCSALADAVRGPPFSLIAFKIFNGEDGGIACGEFDDGGSEFRVVSLFAGSVGSLHLVKSSGGRWCEEAWGWRVLCQIH